MSDEDQRVIPDEDRANNVLPFPAAAAGGAGAGPPWGPDLDRLRHELARLRHDVEALQRAVLQLTWDVSLCSKQLREHTHPSGPPRGVTVIPMDGGGS